MLKAVGRKVIPLVKVIPSLFWVIYEENGFRIVQALSKETKGQAWT